MAPKIVFFLLVVTVSLHGSAGFFDFFAQAMNKAKEATGMYTTFIETAFQTGLAQLEGMKDNFSGIVSQSIAKVMELSEEYSEKIQGFLSDAESAGASVMGCADGNKEHISEAVQLFTNTAAEFVSHFMEAAGPIMDDMKQHFEESYSMAKNVAHNVTLCKDIPCLVMVGTAIAQQQIAVGQNLAKVVMEHQQQLSQLTIGIGNTMFNSMTEVKDKMEHIIVDVQNCIKDKMAPA